MAYDDGLAQVFRDDLAGRAEVSEKKMFGGLCFLNSGHMLCGVHQYKDSGADGAMFRVGPDNYLAALSLPGVRELSFTGRAMKGLAETDGGIFSDDAVRGKLLEMALSFTSSLPPK